MDKSDDLRNDLTDEDDEEEFDLPSHAGLSCHVTTDEEFRAAVLAGIESARIGPNRPMEEVVAEILASIRDH